MKIGIDYVSTVGGGGNAVYSKNLIAEILSSDHVNHYYLYVYVHDYLLGRHRSLANAKVHLRPAFISSLGLPAENVAEALSRLLVRTWAKLDGLDIFHFTNPIYFSQGIKNTVVTIHDLSPLHNPKWVRPRTAKKFAWLFRYIKNTTVHLIAVSKFTKDDLIEKLKIKPEHITVVHEAADKNIFYPDPDHGYLKSKFGLVNFVLYVGQIQPRKNIRNLVKAYKMLPNNLQEKFPLVLVGGARDKEYFTELQNLEHIRLLGNVSNMDLRKLYSCTELFVFMSFFEGFGLPVLEAMQCGSAVVTSQASSMSEIASDGAVLTDPISPQEIYLAIEEVLTNDLLRNSLRAKAIANTDKFSWKRAARETVQVYAEVGSRNKD